MIVVVLAVDVVLMDQVIRVFDSIMLFLLVFHFYLMNIRKFLHIILQRPMVLRDRLSPIWKDSIGDYFGDHSLAMAWQGIGNAKTDLKQGSCLPYYSKDRCSLS